jgi:Ca2+-transporting ATPase
MGIEYPITDSHTYAVKEIINKLQSNAEIGLTQKEAELRNKEFGLNIFKTQNQKSIFYMFLLQFKNPIVYLLFLATLVTLYFQNYIESISILAVIFINAIIGFFMELQARNSMNALKEMDIIHSKVFRDGKIQVIASEMIVPGDLISLEAGDVIPGDAYLIESNLLQCDESSLTGESLPSEKKLGKLKQDTTIGDQLNMVFKGTAVTNGNGKAVITGIAKHTQLGTITSLVENSQEKDTPLDRKINVLSKKLIWITLGLTSIFAVSGILQGKEWILIFETSIALAVAAFPEGLPIVVTVALAYGMLLMAKRNAIVKKLSAVETLGSANVIMTDKTGTLTENKIVVDTFCFPEEKFKAKFENNVLKLEADISKSKVNFESLRLIGALCNNVSSKSNDMKKELIGDPIEIALVQFVNSGISSVKELNLQNPRIGENPFSSETKTMGTLHEHGTGYYVAAKGSVEHLLQKCSKIQIGASIQNLNEEKRKKILLDSEEMASNGLRVLAFAYKETEEIIKNDFLQDLVYVAMVGFSDPPRLDIREAILSCRKAGIKIVMITGDHPLTALNIAKKVGLVDEKEQNAIAGIDLPPMDSLSDEWNKKILSTLIFARATPKQKLEIVGIFQKAGNIVVMTGDGVNDAPALKKADIGIAMGLRGTQVAKETASIVLKDDSFTSIAQAVSHGREIFKNIQKFVIYLVSCNLSEIFIVTTLGFLIPSSTLLPLQILFLNMVTDVFPALALGLGSGDRSVMDKPPRDPSSAILSRKNWVTISFHSASMTLAILIAVIYSEQKLAFGDKILNNVAFITLVFAQLFHVFNMSSSHSKIFINEITKNKFIWIALLICVLLLVLVYSISQLRLVLGLEVLAPKIWIVSILSSMFPLIVFQFYKFLKLRKILK